MAKKRILKFSAKADTGFYRDVRSKVYAYLDQQGITPAANLQMVLKTVFFLLLFGGSYYAAVFGAWPGWAKLLACLLHGLSIAAIGFNIAHDAGHDAYSGSKTINRLLFYTMDMVGSNSYMWHIKHNQAHHIYTNINSFDEDITGSYLLRLSPHAPFNRINRYQYIYAWLLYPLLYFYIVWFYNFQQFSTRCFGPFTDLKHTAKAWVQLLGWKSVYFFYAVFVPVWLMDIPILHFIAGYFISAATAGFTLAIIFYLAHCVENANLFPLPVQQTIEDNWAAHQLRTTSNFGMGNRWLTWFSGGLNYQVEHHLFPEICSIHYRRISHIIETTAQQHGLPYLKYDTFGAALRSHQQMLQQLSKP
jgi:linoleoyl-CoA desaturase